MNCAQALGIAAAALVAAGDPLVAPIAFARAELSILATHAHALGDEVVRTLSARLDEQFDARCESGREA